MELKRVAEMRMMPLCLIVFFFFLFSNFAFAVSFFEANISESANLTFDGNSNTFHFLGDNEKIDMRLYAIVNGQKRYLDTEFPGIASMIDKRMDSMKFGATVPIPGSIRNKVTEAGFEFSGNTTPIIFNNSINNYSIIIDDYTIHFNDLVQIGFTVKVNETGVALTNFPNKVQLDLDPTINFTTAAIESKSIAALDNRTFVLGYCDETNDDISIIIFDTNLTNLTAMNGGATDVDNTIGSCAAYQRMVSISAFAKVNSSTDFIVAFADLADFDITYAIYNWNGTDLVQRVAPTDLETTASISYLEPSTTALNTTDAIVMWKRYTSGPPLATTWAARVTNLGVTAVAATQIGATTNENTNFLSCSATALNSTNWAASYSNATTTASTAITATYDYNINKITGLFLVNAGASFYASITIDNAAFNNTHYAEIWDDEPNDDTTFTVVDKDNNAYMAVRDIDPSNGGTSYFTSITSQNSTNMAWVWDDSNVVKMNASMSDGSNGWSSIITVSNPFISVTSYPEIFSNATATGIGFCNGGLIVAWTDAAARSNVSAYNSSGGAWNGSCPSREPDCTSSLSYAGQGEALQWDVNCACYPNITSNINMYNNTINLTGTGTFFLSANITNISARVKDLTCLIGTNISAGGWAYGG